VTLGIGSLLTLAANPVEHVVDKPILVRNWGLGEGWVISNVTVMLILSGIVTLLIILPIAGRIATTGREGARGIDDYRSQGLWANLVETVCFYLRDQVFRPVLHEETDKYTPVLWTFFWFILVNNILGLIPFLDLTAGIATLIYGEHRVHEMGFHGIGGTATQSIWVTGALAVVSFLFYNLTAIIKDPVAYVKHLTAGAPFYMWPIMIPVEIMGMFVKPFALALRLFANMTGGHIIIAVLLSFVVSLIEAMGTIGYGMALVPLLGSVVINLLEIMVAFIQAYIFTFLTCLFLGQLVVHHHEDNEEHGHGDGHPPTGHHDDTVGFNRPTAAPHGAPHA
jgi:F-type H+-transporting ATPase subunit a